MNQTITFKVGTLIVIAALSYVAALAPIAAHGDEEEEVHHEKTELSIEQMEQIITLLQQLVVVLTQYKAQYGVYVPASVAMPIVPVTHSEDEEEHEEEHEVVTTPVATLVIEVEPHNGKTHVHIRYTDKPEEMFFVDPALTDEDAVVAAIVAKTGLSADAVRPALKYIQ